MNKKKFYKEQASGFMDYAAKFIDEDLDSLFNKWAESKDFSDEDKEAIFDNVIFLFSKRKPRFIPRLRVHLKDDPIALKQLVQFILLAIELGSKEDEDDEYICKK